MIAWDDSMKKRSDVHVKNKNMSDSIRQKGYTLVELIVTFALFAIFMTAVVMCLPSMTKIYMQLQQINHEKTICNTVSNEIKSELQVTLGVEGDGDPLGIKNGNGLGYIALLDESGRQIELSSQGAITSGAAVVPATDVSGSGIEFAYNASSAAGNAVIVAQMDADGFDGYTYRSGKKKLQEDYHTGDRVITSGAVVTRYYEADITEDKVISDIQYKKDEYTTVSGSAFTAPSEDECVKVAYAVKYPFVEGFYEGFKLKTTFTIKKDAFYTAGEGTMESPSRVYVNYVNYTLSLFKDDQLCYSQDYVVNVQNAVPYKGTKVAKEPDTPDEPEKPVWGDTYVVEDSVSGSHWDNGGNYTLVLHLPASNDIDDYDMWEICLPERLREAWIAVGNPNDFPRGDLFTVTRNGANLVIRLNKYGYIGESLVTINFGVLNGYLTEEEMKGLEGSSKIKAYKTYEYATSKNVSIKENGKNGSQWNVSYEMKEPTGEKRMRERVTIIYDSPVKEVKTDYPQQCLLKIDPDDHRIVYVYGNVLEAGSVANNFIRASFEDPDAINNMKAPTIKFGID